MPNNVRRAAPPAGVDAQPEPRTESPEVSAASEPGTDRGANENAVSTENKAIERPSEHIEISKIDASRRSSGIDGVSELEPSRGPSARGDIADPGISAPESGAEAAPKTDARLRTRADSDEPGPTECETSDAESDERNADPGAGARRKKTRREKIADLFVGELRKYSRAQIVAINSMVCAFILTFAFFPIQIGALQLAVLQIVAVLICTELLGLANGMLSGLFFGFVSFFTHLTRPGVLSPIFISNPLVTFMPRIVMPVVAFFVARLFGAAFAKIKCETDASKKIAPHFLDTIKYSIAALAGVVANTSGVLGMIYAFKRGNSVNGTAITPAWIAGIIATNSVLEAIVCTIVTPAIVIAVKQTVSRAARRADSTRR